MQYHMKKKKREKRGAGLQVLIGSFILCLGFGVLSQAVPVEAGEYGNVIHGWYRSGPECLEDGGILRIGIGCLIKQPAENKTLSLGRSHTFEGEYNFDIEGRRGIMCTMPYRRYGRNNHIDVEEQPSIYWCPRADEPLYGCTQKSFLLPMYRVDEKTLGGVTYCQWVVDPEESMRFWEMIDSARFYFNLKTAPDRTEHFDPQAETSEIYPLGSSSKVSTSIINMSKPFREDRKVMSTSVRYKYTLPPNFTDFPRGIQSSILMGKPLVVSAYPMYYFSGPIYRGQPKKQWKGGINLSDMYQYVNIENPNNPPVATIYPWRPTEMTGYNTGAKSITVEQGERVVLVGLGDDPDGHSISARRWQIKNDSDVWKTVHSFRHPYATIRTSTYGSGNVPWPLGVPVSTFDLDTSKMDVDSHSFRLRVYDLYGATSIGDPEFAINVIPANEAMLTLKYDDGSHMCTGTPLPDSPNLTEVERDGSIEVVACDENDVNVTGDATWGTSGEGNISMTPSDPIDSSASMRVIAGVSVGSESIQASWNDVSDNGRINVTEPPQNFYLCLKGSLTPVSIYERNIGIGDTKAETLTSHYNADEECSDETQVISDWEDKDKDFDGNGSDVVDANPEQGKESTITGTSEGEEVVEVTCSDSKCSGETIELDYRVNPGIPMDKQSVDINSWQWREVAP